VSLRRAAPVPDIAPARRPVHDPLAAAAPRRVARSKERRMKTRPVTLLASAAVAAAWAGAAEPPSLKDLAPKSLLVGAAINRAQAAEQDPVATAIVTRQFGQVSPENDLKWERIHPEADRYDFGPADRYVEFGRRRGMFVVGHVLLWHQQTPAWVFAGKDGGKLDRETALARLKAHITAVAGRYKGRIGGWDVVNEALEEDGTLRKTPWLEAIGEDYVERAFAFAREADPAAELYYNDYNLWKPAKLQAAIRLVQGLRAKGLRVDGLGEQAHWGIDDPPLADIDAALGAMRAAGLVPHITELDIDVLPRDPDMWGADLSRKQQIRAATNVYPHGLPPAMQERLARRYADVFRLFLKHGVARVTLWGVTDADSWLHDFPIPGRVNYPLLWDKDGREKPAFDAVVEVLRKHAGR
jgi:endo-1,4-beta-xylanase